MRVVEPGNGWDAIPNGVPGDEDFDSILNILDFPMESLEDDGFVADWDITKSHCLGPIPSGVLMGPPTIPVGKVDSRPPCLSSGIVAPTAGVQEQKTPSDLVKGASGPRMMQLNKPPEAQQSRVFQSQSPVSVLESTGSCSASKSLPNPIPVSVLESSGSCSAGKSLPNPIPVSVLESSGSCSAGKNLPNSIPVRARSKRAKGLSPWLSALTYFTSDPRKDEDEIRKLPAPQANKVENLSPVPNCHVVTKRCTHCDVTKTPQWREGPLGPKTLCNACGVRYRSGRLFPEYRPAASPTFVPALHSNSHKKVIEMRTKGKGPMAEIEKGSTSPQPEFVPMSNYLFDYIY